MRDVSANLVSGGRLELAPKLLVGHLLALGRAAIVAHRYYELGLPLYCLGSVVPFTSTSLPSEFSAWRVNRPLQAKISAASFGMVPCANEVDLRDRGQVGPTCRDS